MQNEERINGLETQVRTLKKLVIAGFTCLFIAGVTIVILNRMPMKVQLYRSSVGISASYSLPIDYTSEHG
jgi:hypothetical protein